MPPETEELMTAEQVAAAIGKGCTKTRVLDWRKAGIIPAEIARGNFVRFDITKVRQALREDAAK